MFAFATVLTSAESVVRLSTVSAVSATLPVLLPQAESIIAATNAENIRFFINTLFHFSPEEAKIVKSNVLSKKEMAVYVSGKRKVLRLHTRERHTGTEP